MQAVFPTGPRVAKEARDYVRAVLARDDEPLGDDRLGDVLLVVSELVTNAHLYGTEADESVLVAVLTTSDRVRIEVHDRSSRRPHQQRALGDRAGGRGLHIVDELAERWDVDDRPTGKAVWAEVAR